MTRALRIAAPLVSVVLVSSIAAAQGTTEAPVATPPAATTGYPPPPAATPPPPPPAPAPAAATTTTTTTTTADGGTDFSKIVGKIGIGYMGQFDVPIGTSRGTGTIATQIVGVRYFFSERLGLDIGIGLGIASGSSKATNTTGTSTTVDAPSTLAFSLKAGVPIVLASTSHYSFFLEPQALFGYAGETVKSTDPTRADTKHTGTRITVGAAAGALVQFGFIGIPQLTLDATVGVAIPDIQNRKTEAGAINAVTSNSASSTVITTYTGHQPWNIFHTNVAAIYHF